MVRQKLDRNRCGIYCWFFCVFSVLGLAGLVAWLSLTPKNPQFTISNTQFPALDVKNTSTYRKVSVSSNTVIFDLEISNPNKRMGIYYNTITFELYSGRGGVVGTNSTSGFYQGYKNTTLFQILVQAKQEFLQAMIMKSGNVGFTVRVKTAVAFRIMRWKTKLHQIAYEKQFSDVKISLNGTISGGNYADVQDASNVKVIN